MFCFHKKANVNLGEQELLDDPAVISAIDEETEFNALVVCDFLLQLQQLLCSFG